MKRKMISIMMLGLMLTMLTGCVHYASPESGKELFSSLGISILVMAVGGVIYGLYWLFGRNSPWFKGKDDYMWTEFSERKYKLFGIVIFAYGAFSFVSNILSWFVRLF